MKQFKRFLGAAISLLILLACTGCISVNGTDINANGREKVTASGKVISKDLDITSDFKSLNVRSIIDVVVTQGNNVAVRIMGSDNIIKYCDVYVNNGTLVVTLTKEGESKSLQKCDLKVYVTSKELNNISVSGTGDVKFEGMYNSPRLTLNISGTGDISVPSFAGEQLNASISGTGDIDIKGECGNAGLSISGTGDIDANLKSLKVLTASISGTGDMDLEGSTESATYSVSGTGEIDAKKMTAKSVYATSNGCGDIQCYAMESFEGTKSTAGGLKCFGNPPTYNLTKN